MCEEYTRGTCRLARGERSRDIAEAVGDGALESSEVQDIAGGDAWQHLAGSIHGGRRAHALDRVQGPHLREHVARQGDLHVNAQPGADAGAKNPSTSRRLSPVRVGKVPSSSNGAPVRLTHSVR